MQHNMPYFVAFHGNSSLYLAENEEEWIGEEGLEGVWQVMTGSREGKGSKFN